MSAETESLGRAVLYLSTDDSALRQGLAQARQQTDTAGKAMRENARVILSADAAALRADLARAQQLIAQGKTQAAKDLTYQIRTDIAQLRVGLSDALRQAKAAKDGAAADLIYQMRVDLARFTGDLRTAQQQATTTARQITETETAFARQAANEKRTLRQQEVADARAAAAQERQAASESRSAPSEGGGGGLLSAIGAGAGFAGGAAAVTAGVAATIGAIKAGTSTVLDYNSALETTRAQVLGFSGDQRAVAQVTALANQAVAQGRGTFSETYRALADLTPLARTYNADLGQLLTTTQLLAAADPAQGFEGAAVAIREALSGDFHSLTARFEIPRTEIQKLKDQGLPNLQIVQKALEGLGITQRVLDTQSQTFSQQLKIAGDEFKRFIATGGQPLFDVAKKSLADFRTVAGSPEFKALGAELHDAAVQAADLATAFLHVAENIGLALGRFAQFNQDLNDPQSGVNKFINKYFPGGDPGTGAVAIPTPGVTPGLPVAAPQFDNSRNPVPGNADPEYDPGKGSALFDVAAAQKAAAEQRRREAFVAGQAELVAYYQGFSQQSRAQLPQLQTQLQSAFDALYGSLSKDEQQDKGLGQIPVIAERIIADIQRYGRVTAETDGQVRAIYGAQADAVLNIATAYGAVAAAQGKVTIATAASAAAAGNLAVVQAAADKANQAAQDKVTALQARAQANAQYFQNQAQAAQDRAAAIGREAANVARAYDDQLRGLQGTLAAISRAADAAQRAFAEQLRAAQGEQQAAQEQASRNAAAYQAVLSGTTDEYEKQNRALSDQERQIIANGNAQVRAALQAKTGADSEVQALEVKQRRDLLALEEKIRAARQPGGAGEAAARALEDQRNLVKSRSDYALDLARQRAAVRGDESDAAKKPVEAAAQAQADADKARTDAAADHVADIQEQARQRAAADDAAKQALQDQIAGVQEQARAAAQMYADRQAGVQEEIRLINERARQQAISDTQAIAGAQAALTIVQQIEAARVNAAKLGATNAQNAANAANAELIAQNNVLTVLGQQNTILNDRIKALQDFIDRNPGILSSALLTLGQQPSAGGGARDAHEDGSGASGASAPPSTAPPRNGGGGGGLFTPPAQKSRYLIPAAALPTYQRINFTAPAPPTLHAASVGAGAAGVATVARQGAVPTTVTLNSNFPNAQFTSDIDVKNAVREGHEAGLRSFLAALDDDSAGGGALSGWRG